MVREQLDLLWEVRLSCDRWILPIPVISSTSARRKNEPKLYKINEKNPKNNLDHKYLTSTGYAKHETFAGNILVLSLLSDWRLGSVFKNKTIIRNYFIFNKTAAWKNNIDLSVFSQQ